MPIAYHHQVAPLPTYQSRPHNSRNKQKGWLTNLHLNSWKFSCLNSSILNFPTFSDRENSKSPAKKIQSLNDLIAGYFQDFMCTTSSLNFIFGKISNFYKLRTTTIYEFFTPFLRQITTRREIQLEVRNK